MSKRLPSVEEIGNMIVCYWQLFQASKKFGDLNDQVIAFHKFQLCRRFAKEFYYH